MGDLGVFHEECNALRARISARARARARLPAFMCSRVREPAGTYITPMHFILGVCHRPCTRRHRDATTRPKHIRALLSLRRSHVPPQNQELCPPSGEREGEYVYIYVCAANISAISEVEVLGNWSSAWTLIICGILAQGRLQLFQKSARLQGNYYERTSSSRGKKMDLFLDRGEILI